ncbi:MAG: hypothetical protein ACRDKT_01630 [Actinomycetota bacterium]
MARLAFAIPVTAGAVEDIRRTAAELRDDAFDEYGRSRKEVGFTSVEIWLQETSRGHLVVIYAEGDIERAFPRIATDSGFDEWARQKLLQWAESAEDVQRAYSYPQSEELLVWRLEN